jgi:hypothetical protein
VISPPCRTAFCFHGNSNCDTVQPVRHRLALANRPAVLREYQKRRLECVFRVLFVVQHPATHAQHHRSVPGEQRGKRALIAAGREVIN